MKSMKIFLPKCSTNGNLSPKPVNLVTNFDFGLLYKVFILQSEIVAQKCEIKESIKNSINNQHHQVVFYPQYHRELNHIDQIWQGVKKQACEKYQYTLDDLRCYILQVLTSVLNHVILAYYHCYQRKINLHRENIGFSFSNWKAHTKHQKPTNKNGSRQEGSFGIVQ